MIHVTHKSCVKIVSTIAVTVACCIALSASSMTEAADFKITKPVSNAVDCYAFSAYAELGHDVTQVYLRRIGKATGTAGAVYRLGYARGMVNGTAATKAKSIASLNAERVKAGKLLYKLSGCTINETL